MLRTIQGRIFNFMSLLIFCCFWAVTPLLFGNGGVAILGNCPVNGQPNCTEMYVDISTACLMPCTNSDYFVRFANFGDEVADNASVLVTLDSTLTVNAASLPFTNQGNNRFLFLLGDVQPGAFGQFSINVAMDCDVAIGQSHCAVAQAFPNSTCSPIPAIWDGSDIEIEIVCQGDSVYFTLNNIGSGDMSEPSQCIIIEDDLIVMVSGYYLPAGGDTTIVLPNNGGFYHFEAGLTAGNPKGFFTEKSIEGCGSISTGYLTQYPTNDSLAAYESTCLVNDTACHFNRKIAFPEGIGPNHSITIDIPIQYQINYQNTTLDTVSTLFIYDTLSTFLDVASLIAGVSSHDYLVEHLGNNIIRFSFNNINLPPGGFGFVKFQVSQQADTPPCTYIENWAEINFGQDSVLTDTVFHTLNCANYIEIDTIFSICGGGGYYLGNYYSQDAFYTNTTSFSTVTITQNTTIQVFPGTPDETIEATICEGESFMFNGQAYAGSGTYSIPATDANGCSYTITLILTVIENEDVVTYKQICEGETCPFFGEDLAQSGTYSHAESFGNCFRINILVLTVNPVSFEKTDSTICLGDTIVWEGLTLFSDTSITHYYTNIFGCDSITQINLSITPSYQLTIDTAICEGELFYVGQSSYGSAGTYTDTLQTYQYCDSIITLNLSILPNSESFIAAVICEGESYQVGNANYALSGTYSTVLPAANGCDSLVTLELLVQAKDTSCFANAGIDTTTCGFTWELVGTPSPGAWEVVCSVSDGEAAFQPISDSSAVVSVGNCGSYYFKYTHTHFDTLTVLDPTSMSFDTIIDTCVVSDFVKVDFEDPSFSRNNLHLDLDVTYNDYTCPEDNGVTCNNIFEFEGVTPIPSWVFDGSSSCEWQIVTPNVGSILQDCLASEITYSTSQGFNSEHTPQNPVGQDDFLVLDSTNQTVIENHFLDYLDSLFNDGLGSIEGQCPPAPAKCFPPPPCQPELLGYDTAYWLIPIHQGGRWSYLDELGNNVPMDDTTLISLDQEEIALVASPNARTYSPVQFSLWIVLPNDSLAAPTTATTVTLQWQEMWSYDSIQFIRPIYGALPDSCSPICPNLSGTFISQSPIPAVPSYDCPPFSITFEGTTLVLSDSIVCDTYTYIAFIKIAGGTPPYTVSGLSGSFVSSNLFMSDPIPINLGYAATVVDSAGCEATITGENCRCLNFQASSPFTVEANCVDSCVVLVGMPIGAGNQWQALWCDETGVIATDTAVTVCEPGIYFFKVIDQLTGCMDTAMTTVFVQLPNADAGPNMTISCEQNMVTLLGAETTGDAPILFSWEGPGITPANEHQQQPTVSEPSTYTLTVTNTTTGCSDTDFTMVASDATLPNAVISSPGLLNCITPTQVLYGNQSTPSNQLIFNWSTADGNIQSDTHLPSITINEGGVYFLTVVNTVNGCIDMAQVTVTSDFSVPSLVSAGPDSQLDCDHESLQLQGASSTVKQIAINWSSTSGHIVNGDSTLMPMIDEPGEYVLSVTHLISGCTVADTVVVVLDTLIPSVNILLPQELNCINLVVELNGDGSSTGPEFQYDWASNNGQPLNNGDSLVALIDMPGTYYLTVLNADNGCEAMDSVQIEQNIEYPSADAGQYRHFSCITDSLQLDGTLSDTSSHVIFGWLTLDGHIASGGTTPTPWVDEPGIFVLQITDTLNGCQTTDTVIVEAYRPVSFELVVTPDCLGSDVGSVVIPSLLGQADDYFFILDNGQVWYDSQIEGLSAGEHTLTVLDQDSCAVQVDFSIEEVPPLPPLAFEESYHFCGEDNPVILDGTVGIDSQWVQYFWSNGENTPVITSNEDGFITLEVSTACELATYEIELIDDLRRKDFFKMPNVFTPNKDDLNDLFGPVTPHELGSFEMMIFDRWGEKVFSTNSMDNLWDGTYKGHEAASDVYIFKVVASYMDCKGMPYKISQKGDLTLLR